MVTCVFDVTWAGAVYRPVALIVPIGCADQVTFVYGCPPRLAANCCVPPGDMDAPAGLTLSAADKGRISIPLIIVPRSVQRALAGQFELKSMRTVPFVTVAG